MKARIERSYPGTRSPTRIWGVLLAVALLADLCPSAQTLDDPDRETDKRQMLQIHDALSAYREKHGRLPDWLSDLVPEFLPDAEVLISPVERRTGRSQLWGYVDPKLKTSYVYEFSANSSGRSINQDRRTPLTMKEWKTLQMQEFGPAIPLLRCHLHDPILNLSFSGEIYDTTLFWESDPNTLALSKRLGPGPGLTEQQTVQVTVLDDETGEPLAGVAVTASGRRSELGPLPPRTVSTDATGVCQVPLGGMIPETAALEFAKAGHANAPIQWEAAPIPEEVTVRLPKAVAVGGIVRGKGTAPVSGAAVVVSGLARDVVGQVVLVEYDRVETDSEGRWSSPRVPRGVESLHLAVEHPDHLAAEIDDVDPGPAGSGQVLRADLLSMKATIALDPAPAVDGTVRAEDDSVVEGALVVLRDTTDTPTRRTARTGRDGRFRFVVREPGTFQLLASAPSRSPAFKEIEVEPGLEPLDLVLAKGKRLDGRVLDAEDRPVPDATVSVQSWNDVDLLSWAAQTDAEGRFSWDAAPDGTVLFTVWKEGFQRAGHPASAGDETPITLRLAKSFLLTGRVMDANTSEPIQQFRIVRAMVYGTGPDGEDHLNWEFYNEKTGAAGQLSVNLDDQPGFGGEVKFMIRADGYLPVMTKTFPTSGWHAFDATLKRGKGPEGIVHDPRGKPVEGAEVVLLGAGHVSVGKAKLVHRQNQDFVAVTDTEGHFKLPALFPAPKVMALHESGFASVDAEALAKDGVVQLQRWSRIEGTAKAGTRPWVGQELMLGDPGFANQVNYDWSAYKVTTDADGRFAFDYVPPGQRQIVRLVKMTERSWSHSHIQPVTVAPGETVQITYGGTGRPVIGRLALSDPARSVDFNVGHRSFGTRQPRPPAGMNTIEAIREWQNLPEVLEARRNHRYYALAVEEDGSFRLDNIPPGAYDLSIQLNEPGEQEWQFGESIGSITREVVVSEVEGSGGDEPIDLGELVIQVRATLNIGDMAPEFDVPTLESGRLKLSDLRGKYVLLDFWATWCGPCVAELPHLKETYDALASDDRFVMVGLSLDQETDAPRDFVKKNDMKWLQGFLGNWSETDLPAKYGVQGIPATFVIDPDGRIAAKGMRGPAMRAQVETLVRAKEPSS